VLRLADDGLQKTHLRAVPSTSSVDAVDVLSTCLSSCRETHILPDSLSCFEERKPRREFGGKFTGKKKMHPTECIRELPGRAEYRLPGRPHLPRVSRPPSPNHKGEGGRETLHAGVQAISGPSRRGDPGKRGCRTDAVGGGTDGNFRGHF